MLPSIVFANSEKQSLQISTYETVCLNAKDLTSLVDEFKELPYVRGVSRPVVGEDSSLPLVIFVNPDSKTFTIVERAGADIYCILAVGANFQPVPKHLQDEVKSEQEKGRL